MCARVANQWSRGVVIARLRLSVRSLLDQCARVGNHQSTYLNLAEDQELTSHHRTPHTRKQPHHSRLKRRGHQTKKN
jgi:hypothetical protein